ncbi:GIY-YIG nuclease family protein [Bosea sp. RCC_152_1]|uniref:GIY-YIG nuclease family protein n=1 Tax=Bosea sp. RCC_152_1 TaxID=3239228 RepID=UPI003525E374
MARARPMLVTEILGDGTLADAGRHLPRYYSERNGRAYWEPRGVIPAGFESRPLGPASDQAKSRAVELYEGMRNARKEIDGPVLTPSRRQGYLYFLMTARFVKIGFSTQPFGRASALKTGLADEMTAFVIIKGKRSDERRLHDEFAGARVRGEWFALNSKLRDAIARAAAGQFSGGGF